MKLLISFSLVFGVLAVLLGIGLPFVGIYLYGIYDPHFDTNAYLVGWASLVPLFLLVLFADKDVREAFSLAWNRSRLSDIMKPAGDFLKVKWGQIKSDVGNAVDNLKG